MNLDLTCFLGAVQDRGDLVAKGSVAVVPWSGGVDTQGSVVGLHAAKVSRGCAGAVRHLLVHVVRLWEPNMSELSKCSMKMWFKYASLTLSTCQSPLTLDRAKCGKVSITRSDSSPDLPPNWPLSIRAAVTVGTPIPGIRRTHT